MQGGVGHGDAADKHRLELGHRGDGTGAAHLELNVLQQGHLLFCRELVGSGPARRAGNETELPLQGDVIHLVDHAVDLIGEIPATRQDIIVKRLAAGGTLFELHFRAEWQPPLFELIEATEVRATELLASHPHAIGVEGQRAAGGDA